MVVSWCLCVCGVKGKGRRVNESGVKGKACDVAGCKFGGKDSKIRGHGTLAWYCVLRTAG